MDLVNHKFWATSISPVIQAAFYIGGNLETFASLFETGVESIIPILNDEIAVIEICYIWESVGFKTVNIIYKSWQE